MRSTRSTPQRGAVLLLAVYFVSMALLLLGGVSLQRTVIEVRAAQVSRDTQQAFYLAEGAVDQALVALKQDPQEVMATPTYALSTPSGTHRYTVSRLYGSFSWQTATQDVLYHISGTGTAGSNVSTTVATVVGTQQEPLQGVIANGSIWTDRYGHEDGAWSGGGPHGPSTNDYLGPTTIEGDLRVHSGAPNLVYLDQGVTVDGDLTVSAANPVGGYQQLTSNDYREDRSIAAVFLKPPHEEHGFGSAEGGWGYLYTVPGSTVTGQIRSSPTSLAPLPAAETPDMTCYGSVHFYEYHGKTYLYDGQLREEIGGGHTVHIRDGGPLDATPAGDGRVEFCAESVTINPTVNVIVHDPAVLFVTGQRGTYFSTDYSGRTHSFLNVGQVRVVGNAEKRADRGFTVVDTGGGSYRYTSEMFMGDFEGSVYAPQSRVIFENNHLETDNIGTMHRDQKFEKIHVPKRRLGFVIGKDVEIGKVYLDFMHSKKKKKDSGSSGASFTPNVLSWTQ